MERGINKLIQTSKREHPIHSCLYREVQATLKLGLQMKLKKSVMLRLGLYSSVGYGHCVDDMQWNHPRGTAEMDLNLYKKSMRGAQVTTEKKSCICYLGVVS